MQSNSAASPHSGGEAPERFSRRRKAKPCDTSGGEAAVKEEGMNKIAITIIALLALSAAACGKHEEVAAEKPVVVQGIGVAPVAASAVKDYYEATGTVRSKTATVIAAKIMGTVTSLRVREGDHVSAGQVLLEIDNREAAAQVAKSNAGYQQAQAGLPEIEESINAAKSAQSSAEAAKRLADATLARYQALLERKSVSPQEFDEVKMRQEVARADAARAADVLKMMAAKKQQVLAQIEQGKADVANAQVHLSYSRIVSPVTGRVTQKQIEPGATVTPGAPLLTIEDSSRYRLEAVVEESQLARIRMGQPVEVRIDALGMDNAPGTVTEIVPSADSMSRSVTVKIDLPARQLLRSGLYGTARFASGERQAIMIPQKALVQQGQLTSVFVIDENGIARLRLIKTGRADGDRIEILSGLNPGERIAVEGISKLREGNKVS
jgi:multidrug efflux pump subunit AcrA (membrane-fusion protein)